MHEQDDTVHDAVAMQTQEAYACPRRIDWPVYDQEAGEYVACAGEDDRHESMLELSAEEAKSLQLAEVYVDFRHESGKLSKGPTFNHKKLSVVRVEWMDTPVAQRATSIRARAALRYFERHPTYAHYL